MKAYCVLFNPLAGGGQGEIQARALSKKMPEDALRFVDITAVKEYAALFASLGPEEGLIRRHFEPLYQRYCRAEAAGGAVLLCLRFRQ